MNHEIHEIKERSLQDKIIDRYVYPSNVDISLDSNGLLLPISKDFLKYTSLITLQKFAKLPGAILLAEGGMGKTIFMQQLKNQFPKGRVYLVELGLYSDDRAGLREDIRPFLQTAKNSSTFAFIFDGLDEAVDLSGAVLRLIHRIPKTSTIWIASRDVSAIRSIQSELSNLKTYSLAPLSEQNIRELAVDNGIDGDNFLNAVDQQGIAGICAKPLGCKLALDIFRDNDLADVIQRDLWDKGIRRLCDETPSTTRRLARQAYSLDQIVECSAWIALCLTLSDSTTIWVDEQSYCPQQCIGISILISDKFPLELIRTTLVRGVFTPLGDGRIRFAHLVYRDYLAAYGLTIFIPPMHWATLLLTADRSAVFPQRIGIARWVAVFNQGFLEEFSGIQPEFLLASMDTVQAIGPAELCSALLDRVDSISYQQRHSDVIAGNLFRLASSETSDIIRDCLLDNDATDSAVEFATEIAKACEFSELSDVFADRVLDSTLPFCQHIEASYALYRLKDTVAQEGELGVLKTSAVTYGCFRPDENKRIVDGEIKRARVSPASESIIISRMNTKDLVGANVYIEKDFPNLRLPDHLWQMQVKNKKKYNPRWLGYLMASARLRSLLSSRATGTSGSMKNISKQDVLSIRIPLPPLPEQKKIAEILSAWDRAIEQVGKLIDAKQRLKKGLMQ